MILKEIYYIQMQPIGSRLTVLGNGWLGGEVEGLSKKEKENSVTWPRVC